MGTNNINPLPYFFVSFSLSTPNVLNFFRSDCQKCSSSVLYNHASQMPEIVFFSPKIKKVMFNLGLFFSNVLPVDEERIQFF